MAIFPDLPGLEVTIKMNGAVLQEYDDTEEEEVGARYTQYQISKLVSRYIESQTDQEFSFELSVGHPFKLTCSALSFHIYVDGIRAASPLLLKRDFKPADGWKDSRPGVVTREGRVSKMRNFKFSEIKTTTEERHDIRDDIARCNRIGDLEVRIYRMSKAKRTKARNLTRALGMQQAEGTFHEKVLKGQAKSHGTAFAEATITRSNTVFSCEFLDGKDKPITIFRFKYRSLNALQSLLILPREASPDRDDSVDHVTVPAHNNSDSIDDGHQSEADPLDVCRSAEEKLLASGFLAGHRGSASLEAKSDTSRAEERLLLAGFLAGLRGNTVSKNKAEQGIKRERAHAGGLRKKVKQEKGAVIDLTED